MSESDKPEAFITGASPDQGDEPKTDASQRFLDEHLTMQPDESFCFDCHPGVPCFNVCCSAININLLPYDAMRLRSRLRMQATDFADAYANLIVAPDTGFPMLNLKLLPDVKESCPFVGDGGCGVYPDRPSVCRGYPLGRAVRFEDDGTKVEQIMLIQEPHCRGFDETRQMTPATWFKDQGLEPYSEWNDRFLSIMARQKATGRKLDKNRAQMAYLALYDPENFRNFIGHMGLFKRLELTPEREAAVMSDPEALLAFGYDWMELVLFGASDGLKPRA